MSPSRTIHPKPDSNLREVGNIVAVASGKGGVGKSTIAVNLALAFSRLGAKTGLFDADIYGPSQPLMLGIGKDVRPRVVAGKQMLPVEAHGIKCNSVGLLVEASQAMAWRGPMVVGAFNQILNDTQWGELDYLVVDMPPGTGDIQLSLAQTVPVTGAVIVTTPQEVALLDARRGIAMFRKVEVPILGIVENMSSHVCSACGHREVIFGEGGARRVAAEYEVELLGQLPLEPAIRRQGDLGNPAVADEPAGTAAAVFLQVAKRVSEQLSALKSVRRSAMPNITISDD